jgi:hypothetical protein
MRQAAKNAAIMQIRTFCKKVECITPSGEQERCHGQASCPRKHSIGVAKTPLLRRDNLVAKRKNSLGNKTRQEQTSLRLAPAV